MKSKKSMKRKIIDDITSPPEPEAPPVKKKQPRGRKNKHYVDSKKFALLIEEYYKTDILTDELAENVYKIASRLIYAPNFINYTYREDMVGDAIEKMLRALRNQKFKSEKGNAFSYFTKIAFNAFRNRIKKEKRIHEAILQYQEETYNQLVSEGYIPYNGHIDRSEQNEE